MLSGGMLLTVPPLAPIYASGSTCGSYELCKKGAAAVFLPCLDIV